MPDKKKRIIVIAAFALVTFLFVFKAFFGFDWSDEAHYFNTANRMLNGDRLFQEIQGPGMFPAVIVLPLVFLYKAIAESTEGILIFMRFCYIALTLATSVLFYCSIKKHTTFVSGLLASLIFFSFSSVVTLSYNTMMIQFTAIAILLIVPHTEVNKSTWIRYALSGFFTALAVQSYPTAVIVIPVFILYILLEKSQGFTGKKQKLTVLLCYAGGGFAVALIFLLTVLINSSLSAMMQNFGWVFVDEEHSVGGFSLFGYVARIFGLIGLPLLISYTIVLAVGIVLSFLKNKEYIKSCGNILMWLSVLTATFLVITKASLFGKSMFQYIIYLATVLIMPVMYFVKGRKWHFSIWIFLIGLVMTLSVGYASNNVVSYCIYPMIFAACGTIIYAGYILQNDEAAKKAGKVCLQSAFGILVTFMILSCFTYIYRDSYYTKLNTRLQSGPAKGIYTTAESAKKYEETVSAIDRYMPENGNVLYVKLLPFGYLHSKARPAYSRLWRTNLDSELFEKYYELNPGKLPDAIYIVNENYGVTNGRVAIGEFMQKYIDTHPHETIELDCATILLFN